MVSYSWREKCRYCAEMRIERGLQMEEEEDEENGMRRILMKKLGRGLSARWRVNEKSNTSVE